MFVFTAKFNKRKAVAIVLVLAVILAAIVLIAGFVKNGDSAPDTADGHTVADLSRSVRSPEDIVTYLNALGWLVAEEPLEQQEIVIPREFTGVYADYAQLQTEQGFTLEDYYGMEAIRYTYQVLNYPAGEGNVVADVVVCGGEIIAGDIQCIASNGFMHGLDFPADV